MSSLLSTQVFGTDIMSSVKIFAHLPTAIRSVHYAKTGRLGLGTIIIPGMFISLLLRYDIRSGRRTYVYFWTSIAAYTIGLSAVFVAILLHGHVLPTLIYLIPACVIPPIIVAAARGDLSSLLKYSDFPEKQMENRSQDPFLDLIKLV